MNFTKRLVNRYGVNNPIFINEVAFQGLSKSYIRSKMAKLAKAGELSRFARGVYYVPTMTRFGKSLISSYAVSEKMFIRKNKQVIGFYSGLTLENDMGLTTQVPGTLEITTNAVKAKRFQKIGFNRYTLKKPRVKINNKNVATLQFLDMVERLDGTTLNPEEFGILSSFIKRNNLKQRNVVRIAEYYPKRVMKTLKQTELFNELT